MQREATGQECWKCGTRPVGALVCPACEAIQPVPARADLFAVLSLPRRLMVDAGELERRYHEASRLVHPDRYQTASGRERELSLAASAAVNRAYRTLRDPVARGRYWLEVHGSTVAERSQQVPPALVAEVFETQETLAALRAAGTDPEAVRLRSEVIGLRDGLAARLDGLRDALVTSYSGWNGDGPKALDELKRQLSEIAYLRTLLGDIEDTIGEGLRGTHHRH
jgi:molecular chaperone HscB